MSWIVIFCVPIFCVWFVVITGIPGKISVWLWEKGLWYNKEYSALCPDHINSSAKRIKPLDCESCLAFWLTFIYVFSFNSIDDSILLSGATAFFTIPLKKLL